MNAVEIEEAVSRLAEAPFEPEEFPFAFLEAFGNKQTTIKRLKKQGKDSTNQSDLGGVLQRNNIHLKVSPVGQVTETLGALRESPATTKHKAKFILATDGITLEAENLLDDDKLPPCAYPDFHNHFGFFLPLAGITTVKQIRENAFDIKATGRLNRLYTELLKDNPDWDKSDRQEVMNHFMARLIFCFFAEDTHIFNRENLFTGTVEQMSDRDSANTHEVIAELFRAMCTPPDDRKGANLRNWATAFPYVDGGLFSGNVEVPRFSKVARSYLLHVGNLDWKKINPDIFGSMIQAVAEEDDRSALGMHYTSVPNILKVLNPLFLDDLRTQLEEAGTNSRKLLHLRQRLAKIRVFDPACGSGNFLVIAYKEMRAIEAKINNRIGEPDRKSEIPLSNFRGIEIRHFAAEIARLALVIAKYQCDVLYLGQLEAQAIFLPLEKDNWITCGNALRLDWLSLCPPTGTGVKVQREDLDLFSESQDTAEVEFENEGGETYICGNPPYQGSVNQKDQQKTDLKYIFSNIVSSYKDLDYVAAWIIKATQYLSHVQALAGLVATNSICQGEQVSMLWPYVFSRELEIIFAHTSFSWSNNAAKNAGVTCIIIGLGREGRGSNKYIYSNESKRQVSSISPYLLETDPIVVTKRSSPLSSLSRMITGNLPSDGGHLITTYSEMKNFIQKYPQYKNLLKKFIGSKELINGGDRWCFWITDNDLDEAINNEEINNRLEQVRCVRFSSRGAQSKSGISTPHKFVFSPHRPGLAIAVPKVSSCRRDFMPCSITNDSIIVSDLARIIYDAPLWNMALIASRLHLVWIATVCGKLKNDYRYSNTLGWNTFPVPTLTTQNKTDLTRCAEEILLAREHYFPATIADMYDPDRMDKEFPLVREAHERNDETIERIYIGRRFKNDTERLEKLFEMYTKMTSKPETGKKTTKRKTKS